MSRPRFRLIFVQRCVSVCVCVCAYVRVCMFAVSVLYISILPCEIMCILALNPPASVCHPPPPLVAQSGRNALFLAASRGHLEEVRYLLHRSILVAIKEAEVRVWP